VAPQRGMKNSFEITGFHFAFNKRKGTRIDQQSLLFSSTRMQEWIYFEIFIFPHDGFVLC
jgi:hypothetical protein